MASKSSSRPGRDEAKARRKARKAAQRALRRRQREAGLDPGARPATPNRKSPWEGADEETAAREQGVEAQLAVLRSRLPLLLKRFCAIEDPRNPRTIQHALDVVLLYGLLCFVYQMASRREANERMSRPVFLANLQALFPELTSLPHADTLNRLLARIDVEQIQEATVELVQRLLRNETLERYAREGCYLIAVDGTRKCTRTHPIGPEASTRTVETADGPKTEYYVYALEANLVLDDGVSLPLLTEFVAWPEGSLAEAKQDCEQKAFHRLAARLKRLFPKRKFMLLLDGLYPNGPIIARCRRYDWDFMMVLQDRSLSSVWTEARGLERLQRGQTLEQPWGERQQRFRWVNDIGYEYADPKSGRRRTEALHLVICEESWEEIAPDSEERIRKTARHAWISNRPLHSENVHIRCNRCARHRWSIETGFLVEKHQGYAYEHLFSLDWQAMKGFHYLMRLAHLLNTLVLVSTAAAELVAAMSNCGFLLLIRGTLEGPWLDAPRLAELRDRKRQLRIDTRPPQAA